MMLPTYPKIIARRRRANRLLMKQLVSRKSQILGEIGQHTIHEGKAADIIRHDGSIGRTEMKQHSAMTEIKKVALSEFGVGAILGHLSEMAEQFAETMTKSVLDAVSEGAESVGNVIDGKGRPISGEVLLEALEQIEHDFDDDGTWHPPTIVLAPGEYEKLMSAHSPTEMEEFGKRADAIVERKRVEHRRREAGRILAG